jgi:uncharacterized membrane protein
MVSFIRPEFFDIFGLAVFSFITILSIWSLRTYKPFPRWALVGLFLIGVSGLIVDGFIVYMTYIQ